MLHQSEIGSAERERKIRRQRAGDAEFARELDYTLHADVVEQTHGGDVARISESAAIGDASLEFVVVVVRRIILAAAAEGDRLVDHRVERRDALLERVGVNVNLERAAGLPQSLRGAVELRIVEIVAADHGFDFAGGIVDGEQSGLRRRLLFELDLARWYPRLP